MESKKISNGQEFIQPDSILLPQKEKKSKRLRRTWAGEGWASEAADWGLGAEGGG